MKTERVREDFEVYMKYRTVGYEVPVLRITKLLARYTVVITELPVRVFVEDKGYYLHSDAETGLLLFDGDTWVNNYRYTRDIVTVKRQLCAGRDLSVELTDGRKLNVELPYPGKEFETKDVMLSLRDNEMVIVWSMYDKDLEERLPDLRFKYDLDSGELKRD